MAKKLLEGASKEDQTWLAEVTYRFAFDAVYRSLPPDANAARSRLEAGNRAFAELLDRIASSPPAKLNIAVDPHDVGLLPGRSAAPKQQPFAAIVGCADARVPVELIFSEGPNDLFVVRVAGNGMGDDVTASLSYAVDHLKDSLRTIVILGHSGCGAVSAAVDVYLEPAKMQIMTQKDLRQILDSILIVIQLGATWLERVYGTEVVRRPGYRTTLIEVAIALNAALTGYGIRSRLNLAARGEIEVVYGVYLLEERLVWSPRGENPDWFHLSAAPRDPDDFVILCDLLVSCPRVLDLLATTPKPVRH